MYFFVSSLIISIVIKFEINQICMCVEAVQLERQLRLPGPYTLDSTCVLHSFRTVPYHKLGSTLPPPWYFETDERSLRKSRFPPVCSFVARLDAQHCLDADRAILAER